MTSEILKPKRYDYLDNLKVLLIVLVIFHHAGQPYGDGGAWGYQISNPEDYAPWLWRFFSINAAFFMGLYFMISGFFVPGSYQRQGFWKFMGKKFMRLGIPLAVMGGFLTAVTGKVDLAQMWFVEQLLFYCIVFAVLMVICGLCRKQSLAEALAPAKSPAQIPTKPLRFLPSFLFLMALAVGLSALSIYVRSISPQDGWIWLFGFLKAEPAHMPQYVLLFVMGLVAWRRGWLDRMPKSVGITSLVIAMAIALDLWFAPKDSWALNLLTQHWAVMDSFTAIFMCTGLIWLFRDSFNKTNKFMKWCSAQAYGAYFFHILLMLGFQNMIDGISFFGGTGKFLLVGVVITIVSFGLTWLVRLIPGVKKVL